MFKSTFCYQRLLHVVYTMNSKVLFGSFITNLMFCYKVLHNEAPLVHVLLCASQVKQHVLLCASQAKQQGLHVAMLPLSKKCGQIK